MNDGERLLLVLIWRAEKPLSVRALSRRLEERGVESEDADLILALVSLKNRGFIYLDEGRIRKTLARGGRGALPVISITGSGRAAAELLGLD